MKSPHPLFGSAPAGLNLEEEGKDTETAMPTTPNAAPRRVRFSAVHEDGNGEEGEGSRQDTDGAETKTSGSVAAAAAAAHPPVASRPAGEDETALSAESR